MSNPEQLEALKATASSLADVMVRYRYSMPPAEQDTHQKAIDQAIVALSLKPESIKKEERNAYPKQRAAAI